MEGEHELRGRIPLNEQFEEAEVLEIAGGSVEVIDVAPETLKTEVPTVVAPGWAVTSQTFRENILALADCGRRVISVDAPHGVETGENMTDIPDAELRKVVALIGALEKKDVAKVDVVAHSEGGLYAVLAASLYPERFRSLVLVDPVGLIEDTPKRLAVEFSKEIFGQAVRGMKDGSLLGPILKSSAYAVKSVARNPRQAFRQFLAMSSADVRGLLDDLKARGVGISVIHGVDDKAFPMERIQKAIDARHVDGFYSVKGAHNEIFLKPQELSRVVDRALDALERKRPVKG